MRGSERSLRVDKSVGAKRVPGVPGCPEQRPTPERRQLREVLGPVDPGNVVEHRMGWREYVQTDVSPVALLFIDAEHSTLDTSQMKADDAAHAIQAVLLGNPR